jgi:hypothetical protein
VAQDEWTVAPAEPGWWARLGRLVSPGNSRPGTIPFLALVLAALAYTGSLGLDWISASASLTRTLTGNQQNQILISGATFTGTSSPNVLDIAVSNNVSGLELIGVVYGLGGLALLGLGFAVLSRPEQALRWRMAAAGLGIGVLGVVVAAVLRLPKLLLANGATYVTGSLGDVSRSYQPGIFCAVAAAVLPVVAVWIRSAPAARAAITLATLAAPSSTPSATATPAYDPSVWDRLYSDPGRWRRSGSPAPLDLTVTSDDRSVTPDG